MQKNQIMSLLSSESLSAPDVTRPLKIIGNGSMLDGLRTMCSFSYNEGLKNGAIIGSITITCVFGTLYTTRNSIKQVLSRFFDIKKHDEVGIKIQKAFIEDIDNTEIQIIKWNGKGSVNMSERFPGIDWYCDRCNAYLNDQSGFDDHKYTWKCTECGHKNSISLDDIYESEEDFRNPN